MSVRPIRKNSPSIAPDQVDLSDQSDVAQVGAGRSHVRRWMLDLSVVLLVGVFMCVYRIGDYSFGAGDQTTHTKVVQEMLASGNLLNPTVNGKPYYNKPPFKMWLVAGVVSVLGESNFSYRLVDGLCGVALGLMVFVFTHSLLQSRLAAYLAVLTLYGCNLLFFGHGIRNATQDAMMLTLVTATIMLGYQVIERVRNASDTRGLKLYRSAFALGSLVALAILTKNVAGLMAFIVLGLYAATQPQVLRHFKALLGPALLALVTSLVPFGLYIYAQGPYRLVAWQLLTVSEVYKRATQGYHFVNRPYYYLEGIFGDGVTVPPILLGLALAAGLWAIVRNRDRRFTLLMIWAVAPVLVHSLMKSKLLWYIMPALPAFSILTASLVSSILQPSLRALWNAREKRLNPPLVAAFGVIFSLYAVGALGHHAYRIAHKNLEPKVRNKTDEIVEHLLRRTPKGRATEALFFGPQKVAHHERLYWEMLTTTELKSLDYAQLKTRLNENPPDFIIASADHFAEIAALRTISGYVFLKPKYRRRKWQAVISYSDAPLPPHFVHNPERLTFGTGKIDDLYGLKPVAATPSDIKFRAGIGPETAILLRGNSALVELGSSMSLMVASTVPADRGAISMRVYLNGEEVASFPAIAEGFHEEHFTLPPGKWRSGRNVLAFKYFRPDGKPVSDRAEPILFHSISTRLGAPLPNS